MYHRVRKKMSRFIISAILLLAYPLNISSKTLETSTTVTLPEDEGYDNNIIDFDEEYTVKFNKQYGAVPWHANDFNRNTHKYTVIKDSNKNNDINVSYDPNDTKISNNTNVRYDPYNSKAISNIREETTTEDFKIIPLELVSTTEDALLSIVESTTEQDLTVIPLSTTNKLPSIQIEQTVTLPTTTDDDDIADISETTISIDEIEQTTSVTDSSEVLTTTWEPMHLNSNHNITANIKSTKLSNTTLLKVDLVEISNKKLTKHDGTKIINNTTALKVEKLGTVQKNGTTNKSIDFNTTKITDTTKVPDKTNPNAENRSFPGNESKEEDTDVPVFTELDTEDFIDIPEDYYDSKDILPTSTPKTDAISVLFGLAGSVVESVVESVAEKVVPKSIYDLFKRMQKQNEALEAERLRSREENGGIGL